MSILRGQIQKVNQKKNPVGVGKKYTSLEFLELSEEDNVKKLANNSTYFPMLNINISDTNILVIDIDENISIEEIYKLFPILKNTYYTLGTTVGFHFYIYSKNIKNKLNQKIDCIKNVKGDFINRQIWEFPEKELYGNKLVSLTDKDLENIFINYPDNFVKNSTTKIEKVNEIKHDPFEYLEFTGDPKEVEEIVMNMPKKYADSYDDWIKIVSILKRYAIFDDLAETFSRQSKKYNHASFKVDYKYKANMKDYKIGTVYWYSKQNRTNFDKIKKKYLKKVESVAADNSFDIMNEEFNKQHFKVINKSMFCKYVDNRIYFFKKQSFIDSYSHLYYTAEIKDEESGEIVKKNFEFLPKWLKCNPTLRIYEDIDIYPNASLCPSNHFNLWTKFQVETYDKNYIQNEEGLDRILNHIKILCNHNEEVNDYVLDWIGHSLLYPEEKPGTLILFVSLEGCGKGLLFQFLRLLYGFDKVFETSNIGRDILGSHNAPMATAYMCILDEADYGSAKACSGMLKNMITEPTLTINPKGKDQIIVKSYHRFIGSTNNINAPMPTSKGDRRKLIIRCSDELCGDKVYGKEFARLIQSKNIQQTFYDYVVGRPNIDTFRSRDLPTTEYQTDIQELNKCYVRDYIELFVYNSSPTKQIVKSSNLFNDFQDNYLKEENVLDIKYTHKKFSLMISNLNIKGLTKKRENKGIVFVFDMKLMKESLGFDPNPQVDFLIE